MRISPTAKITMLNLGLKETDLPKEKDNMVINRDLLMKLLEKGLGKSQEKAKGNINSNINLNFSDDASMHFDKNFIPQAYYNEIVNVDKLLMHVNNLNKRNKNEKDNVGIEDFVARVKLYLNI